MARNTTTKAPTSSSKADALRLGKDVRIAWILLLLERGVSYGYALTRELRARGLDADSAATYRILRKLDHAGWVQSTWTGSSHGPQRRSYDLTGSGRHALSELATLIAATRDVQEQFLREYAPEPRRHAPPITFPARPAMAT